jgi:hypothetical protein
MKNKNRAQQRQQQQAPRVTVGRRQVAPVLQSPQAKERAKVERDGKLAQENRELKAKLAERDRDEEFHQLDKQCGEIMTMRIKAGEVSEEEAYRQANELNGAIARRKAKGLPAKGFDPHAVLNADAVRHGKAVAVPKSTTIDSHLPPPRPEATVRNGLASVPGDQAAHEATFRAAQQRGQSEAERERLAREDYRERLRRLKLTDPSVGSVPGDPRGFFS